MSEKLVITKKINSILKEKSLTAYRLSKLIGVKDSVLYGMIKGDTPFSPKFKEKIIPFLEVSPDEFEGWILAEKYPKKVLERAIQLKNKKSVDENKLIFTVKIHKLIEAKNLSITAFSREIKYNQGRLSQVILGNKSVSKILIQKISDFSGISEDEIKSWVVADKYSQEALEAGIKILD